MNLDKIIAVRTGKTVYKDSDRVIKVFDSDYSKTDILNEALNQARAEEAGLSVPRLYGKQNLRYNNYRRRSLRGHGGNLFRKSRKDGAFA